MNKQLLRKKAKSTYVGETLAPGSEVWVNGETGSNAFLFAFVGAFTGFVVGLIASVFLHLNYGLNSQFKFILFLIPIFLMFFGGFAGAVVGIGTPSRNRNPNQGWLVSWRLFAKRAIAENN